MWQDEKERLRGALTAGVRLDGRRAAANVECVRHTSVEKSVLQTPGSSSVVLGGTRVLASVSLQVGQPSQHEPRFGDLDVEVCIAPTCVLSTKPDAGTSSALHQEHFLRAFLYDVIIGAQVLDREELCVTEGQAAWKLRLDVTCFSHDGNLTDAALIAATAALQDVHIPELVLNESGHFCSDPSRVPRALRLSKLPVPLTCGVFDGAVMVDPTDEEERVASVVTVVRDAITNEICTVVKSGGAPVLAPAILAVCFELAGQRAKQLRAVLCAADDTNGNPS